jgi:hypothetical protein
VINRDEIEYSILAEGSEDFVGLWEVYEKVYAALAEPSPQKARLWTLSLVENWLARGLVSVGEPESTGERFNSWPGSATELACRMADAWDRLEGEPFTGDVCWLIATPKGKEWVRQYREEHALPHRWMHDL